MMHELAAFASAVASRALSEKILTILQIAELHQLVLHWIAKMKNNVHVRYCRFCKLQGLSHSTGFMIDLKFSSSRPSFFKAIVAKKKRKMEFRTTVQSRTIGLNKQ